jgi:hypothetical protein
MAQPGQSYYHLSAFQIECSWVEMEGEDGEEAVLKRQSTFFPTRIRVRVFRNNHFHKRQIWRIKTA